VQDLAKPICHPCATLPRTQTTKQQKENLHPLTSRGLDLLWRTLSTHLACDSGVSLCSTGSVLRLLSLLCALGSSSLLLALLDSSLTGGGTGFWSLTATLLDHIEGGTDNSTLRLDGTAGSLLGNFLLFRVWLADVPISPNIQPDALLVYQPESQEYSYLRDTLLVLSAEQDSPGNSAGVLALEEEGFGLSILEAEDLGITADVELAL